MKKLNDMFFSNLNAISERAQKMPMNHLLHAPVLRNEMLSAITYLREGSKINPSLSELALELGYASPNSITKRMQHLYLLNYINIESRLSRGIQIVKERKVPVFLECDPKAPVKHITIDNSLFLHPPHYAVLLKSDKPKLRLNKGALIMIHKPMLIECGATVVSMSGHAIKFEKQLYNSKINNKPVMTGIIVGSVDFLA